MSTNLHPPSAVHPKIFISYRREDTQQIAGRLFDRLADAFGEESVLKDVDSIPYGVDFRDYSTRLVQESRIVLVLIGRLWLSTQANGKRRIDDEADLVRLEVEASLRHCSAVIPVLVGDAEPPAAGELPASIANLAYRNAARLRHDPDFRVDSDRLLRRLKEILSEPAPTVARAATVAVPEPVTPPAPAPAASSPLSASGRVEAPAPEAPSVVVPVVSSLPATPARPTDPPAERREQVPPAPVSTPVRERPSDASSVLTSERASVLASSVPGTTEVGDWSSRTKRVVTDLGTTKVAILASVAFALCLGGLVAIVQGPYFNPPAEPVTPVIDPETDEVATPEPEPDPESEWASASSGSDIDSGDAASIAYPPRYENIAALLALGSVAPAPMPGPGTQAGEVQAFGDPPIAFCWCPAGSFKMGSPESDPAADDHEKPQVDVTLTRGFWLGSTEVTQGQWRAVMDTAPWSALSSADAQQPEGDDLAAIYMSWEEALEFCDKLTSQERGAGRLPAGWTYTLPTEAQWEYACRAGTTTRYSFGDEDERLGDYAWYGEAIEGTYVHPVGSKLANPWGLLDMYGNADEWCRDSTDYQMHALAGGEDPYHDQGPSRVARGGAWVDHGWSAYSAQREQKYGSGANRFTGFRLACVPSD